MLYISMHRAINSCRGMVWIGWWNVQIKASIANQRCRRCTFDSLRLASAYLGLCVLCGGQRRRCHASIPMNVFGNINALMVQRHIFYAYIPMNVFTIMNVTTMQRHIFYTNILINVFDIVNVTTMYRRRFYTGIPINVFGNINALMVQLGTSCSFDSPGLARNEPTPGKHSQGDSTP